MWQVATVTNLIGGSGLGSCCGQPIHERKHQHTIGTSTNQFHYVHNTGTRRLSIAIAWEERAYELEKTQGICHGPSALGVGRKGTIHHVSCAISTLISLPI